MVRCISPSPAAGQVCSPLLDHLNGVLVSRRLRGQRATSGYGLTRWKMGLTNLVHLVRDLDTRDAVDLVQLDDAVRYRVMASVELHRTPSANTYMFSGLLFSASFGGNGPSPSR